MDQPIPSPTPHRRSPAEPAPTSRGGAEAGGRGLAIALGGAALLAGMAAVVNWRGRLAEQRHPPAGRMITVNGTRLHYLDVGSGSPIVLVHGNASLLEDPILALAEPLRDRHRIIAFDRPGFGYSERPQDRLWTPEEQADALAAALRALGIGPAVFYGHSFGTTVVLSLAVRHPELVAGLIVASGYYYPERRADSALASLNAVPGIGWISRNTVAPLLAALTSRALVKASFSPDPISPAYEEFPADLVVRPSQIRASAEDAATLYDWAVRNAPRWPSLTLPTLILAGGGDKLIDPERHACRLAEDIPNARLHLWPTAGHLVHHSRRDEAVALIAEFAERCAGAAQIEAAARGDAAMETAT